jgi:hypothetical protein
MSEMSNVPQATFEERERFWSHMNDEDRNIVFGSIVSALNGGADTVVVGITTDGRLAKRDRGEFPAKKIVIAVTGDRLPIVYH